MFFVATAPSGPDGHVNLSPKGHDTFRVLDAATAWPTSTSPAAASRPSPTSARTAASPSCSARSRARRTSCASTAPARSCCPATPTSTRCAAGSRPAGRPVDHPRPGRSDLVVVRLRGAAHEPWRRRPSQWSDRETLDALGRAAEGPRRHRGLPGAEKQLGRRQSTGWPALGGAGSGGEEGPVASPRCRRPPRPGPGRHGRAGVDALLLSVGPDLPWLTGYEAMPLERLTMLVVPRDGDATLVVPRARGAPGGRAPRRVLASGPGARPTTRSRSSPSSLGAAPTAAIGDRTWARFLVDLHARPARAPGSATASRSSARCGRSRTPPRSTRCRRGRRGRRPGRRRAAGGRDPAGRAHRGRGVGRPRAGASSPRATTG